MSPPRSAGKVHPDTPGIKAPEMPIPPKNTLFGSLIRIVAVRCFILLPLIGVIGITNSRWWAENTQGTLGVFQGMIALVGFLVTMLLGEAGWMVQGALAAAWTSRLVTRNCQKRAEGVDLETSEKTDSVNLPLIVGEGIQTGRPAILMGYGAISDVCISLVVPIMISVAAATYKFGVSLGSNSSIVSGIVVTTFLSKSLERMPIAAEGCEDDNLCSWGYLQPRYGLIDRALDAFDYTWASGVDVGTSLSNTTYTLSAGDVPAIDEGTRGTVSKGGIRYMQQTVDVTVTCDYVEQAQPIVCGNNTSYPGGSINFFSACSSSAWPITFSGSIVFTNDTIGLVCNYAMKGAYRDVYAHPRGSKWEVEEIRMNMGGTRFFFPVTLWNDISGRWRSAVAKDLEGYVQLDFPGPCLWGCRKLPTTFRQAVAARVSVTLAEEVFYNINLPGVTNEPLPMRGSLPSDSYTQIYAPGGLRRFKSLLSRLNFGAVAFLDVKKNDFVQVNWWILAFGLLPVIEILAAVVKWQYSCHPTDAICGIVWTLSVLETSSSQPESVLKVEEEQVDPIQKSSSIARKSTLVDVVKKTITSKTIAASSIKRKGSDFDALPPHREEG
ncbi:hypothetical protein HDU96_008669 [Phlyctochytrium bullatum]|nr:hypothetical protein HDU96_008669 [Phlyctochytrium bullatum]